MPRVCESNPAPCLRTMSPAQLKSGSPDAPDAMPPTQTKAASFPVKETTAQHKGLLGCPRDNAKETREKQRRLNDTRSGARILQPLAKSVSPVRSPSEATGTSSVLANMPELQDGISDRSASPLLLLRAHLPWTGCCQNRIGLGFARMARSIALPLF